MQATARGLTAEPLAWDTAHFGFPVGRIKVGGDASGLADALARAGRDGLRLLYVSTPPEFDMPAGLLSRFDGLKVDDRVVFSLDLEGWEARGSRADSVLVTEAPAGQATPALVELAVAAGEYSRFAVDPRIPNAAFRRLYEIWIARSCRREAADEVFVAETSDAPGMPSGLATVAVRDGVGVIGLVAVSPTSRRRGVGRALMGRVHEWLAHRSIRRASVATQETNGPACSLYRACGYDPTHRETVFHFQPSGRTGRLGDDR